MTQPTAHLVTHDGAPYGAVYHETDPGRLAAVLRATLDQKMAGN